MLAVKPVDRVVLKPWILCQIETWLAGELITVLGKCAGFVYLGPSFSVTISKSLMLFMLPSVVPTEITPSLTDTCGLF